MTSLLLTLALCVSQDTAQASDHAGDPVSRFADARVVGVLDGIREHLTRAPDGLRVGAVLSAGGARILDARSGAVSDPHAGQAVQSLALGAGADGDIWMGLADGSIVHRSNGAETRWTMDAGGPLDGLVLGGDKLGWSQSKEARGGVLDAASGVEVLRWDKLTGGSFGGYRTPRVFLTDSGRYAVVHHKSGGEAGRWGNLEVYDTRTRARLISADPYICHAGPGFALADDFLLHGRRAGSHDWRVERVAFEPAERSTIDDDARGGHFIDLRVSPSGRAALEGDFEDDGAVLYDLTGARPRRVLGGDGVLPVGFQRFAGGREVALTTAATRAGLAVWSLDGELLVPSVKALAGKRVTGAGPLLDGAAVWVTWWDSDGPGTAVVYHVTVLALE